MTILLSNDEIAGLLDINDVLVALEEAYREAAAGRAILGSRADMVTETPHPDAVYLLKCMGSTIASLGVGAIRINSDILSFPTIDGKQRRRKVPAAPGKRWTGLVLLFSNETGEPLMIFPRRHNAAHAGCRRERPGRKIYGAGERAPGCADWVRLAGRRSSDGYYSCARR